MAIPDMTGDCPQDASSRQIPLVAIGASAGGLEPLEAFFEAAPAEAGWCYVVLQHLSPDYRSMMDEILGRKSRLRIRHIADGARLEPDTLFLNPPNTIVELEGDRFRTAPYEAGDTLPHLPIDAFFYAMAARGGSRSFAVILSGSGADGARGAYEVQRHGGKVLVQTPAQAKFSSMPRAVLASGAVDRVLDPADMPKAIEGFLAAGSDADADAPRERRMPDEPGPAILHLLEREHGIDFSAYKEPTVLRRIERRQQLRGHDSLADYRAALAADPEALEELYHDMLIGVTEFYRDPDAIASLSRLALSTLVARSDAQQELRIWVPACASGEEAYTIGIELCEAMRAAGVERRFRILATDVHRPSIQAAAAGLYPRSALDKLPQSLRERYFIEHRDGMMVDPELRGRVIFSVHDVLRDPPFMRLDLISCRNLLIYLDEDAQQRVISMFMFGLKRDGFLFLGASESLGAERDEFAALDSKWRLYRKSTDRRGLDQWMLSGNVGPYFSGAQPQRPSRAARPPLTEVDRETGPRRDRDSVLRGYDALLKRYAPSSILITLDGAVLTWFGAASAYIDTMSGLADLTVAQIVDPALHYPIEVGIEALRRDRDAVSERHVTVGEGADAHRLALRLEPLGGRTPETRFALVHLRRLDAGDDGAAGPGPETAELADPAGDRLLLTERIRDLERDLRLTEESLQYVTERLEASGEELQASNEELQASNEELQAANEELQSSNEELHAVNEELVAVTAEHERKIDELSALNSDTERAFEILGVGVVIADADRRLRRYTALAGRAFGLMPQDVGRPIGHVGARPDFVDTDTLARAALTSGATERAEGIWHGGRLAIEAVPFGQDGAGKAERGVVMIFSGQALHDDPGGAEASR